jgi:hypothetical protein
LFVVGYDLFNVAVSMMNYIARRVAGEEESEMQNIWD